MATLLKVLNNLADIKSAGVLHFASELRLAKQCDTFRPEPPVEEECRGFCDHEQNHLVELEEGRKPGGKANGVSRKIGLWNYFTEKRDDDGREYESAHASQDRFGE